MNTEKISINVNLTELGQVDYLVEKGLFTSRSDFIRLAIHKQLEAHTAEVNRYLHEGEEGQVEDKKTNSIVNLGVYHFGPREVRNLIENGKKADLKVIGAFHVSKDVTPEDIRLTLSNIKVHGKIFATEDQKQAINQVKGGSSN